MSVLEVQQMSYKSGANQILTEISFVVSQGEYLAISGPSGGGKSTLLKVIASLLTPTSGKILFKDKDQNEYPVTDYRRQVSYCFQQPTLFGKTVRDNTEFPFTIRNQVFSEDKVRELLQLVDLPVSFLDKPIIELSGGERQRVALIRNLMFLPEILLLDEVTVGLDEESKGIVQALVQNVHKQGVTILQVSHDEEDLQQAARVLKMEGGHLKYESIGR